MKKTIKICVIIVVVFVMAFGGVMLYNHVIIPNDQYSAAVDLMNVGNYTDAIAIFEDLGTYKDSADKIAECNAAIIDDKYHAALSLMNDKKYDEAIVSFEALGNYKDSKDKIVACNEGIIDDQYRAALALMSDKKYAEAIVAFEALGNYKDSKAKIVACNEAIIDDQYNAAIALMNNKKYSEAIALFEMLDGYKDTQSHLIECNYGVALMLMETQKYDDAIAILEALNGYKDCKDKITECNYGAAIALMNTQRYDDAISAFKLLADYKDSKDKIDQCNTAKLKVAKVGDHVVFGKYEQDNNISNGKEDIEWLVLEVKDGKALVVSKYALDCQSYYQRGSAALWDICTVRKWLNKDFLNDAFSSVEKEKIPTVTLHTQRNLDNTDLIDITQDKVFLLNFSEVNKFFPSDSEKQCQATEYAKARGTYVGDVDGNCWWWTRTLNRSNRTILVLEFGKFSKEGYDVKESDIAVRPAMWIDLTLI